MPLFDRTNDFDRRVIRNIVSLRESEDLFDDLAREDATLSPVAIEAEAQVKSTLPLGLIERGFRYTTSVAYPFEHEPYLKTRYGDGSYGVWYGALDLKTTIYETCFHMIKEESRLPKANRIAYRERAIYKILCRSLLIDLSEKETEFPGLIAEDYGFTQQIGERLRREGHPGLLAPSARHRGGVNVVAFSPSILSDPLFTCYLSYTCDVDRRTVTVEREVGKILYNLKF